MALSAATVHRRSLASIGASLISLQSLYLFAAFSLFTGASTTLAQEAAAGRVLAEAPCSRCHAVGPRGARPLPKAPPFRILHERYAIENIGEALGEGIFVGHSPMPIFTFLPSEIEDFTAYLRTLEGPDK